MNQIVIIKEIDKRVILLIQRFRDLQSKLSLSIAILAFAILCRDERNLRMMKQYGREMFTRYLIGIKNNDPSRHY